MAPLKLSECICPICLCILVEPVTMPCRHELCMPCFRKNVEQASLSCPMCRMRISNWARRQAGRLVNQERWRNIQQAFPDLCQRRLETGEEGDDDVLDLMTQPEPPIVNVAEPGEIGEEFKKEVEKMREQQRQELEEAAKRSEEYIKKLQKEEVQRLEKMRQEQENQARKDEELARRLAEGDPTMMAGSSRQRNSSQEDQDADLARRLAGESQSSGEGGSEQSIFLSQEEQDAEFARRLAKEDEGEVIHRGEKVHVVREQVMKDEELARRLQMSEQSNSPIPSKSPDVVIISSSSGSSRKSSTSSIKCLSIEKFLSPVAKRSKTQGSRVSETIAIEDQPSTSSHSPTNPSPVEPSPESKEKTKPPGAFSPVLVLKAARLRELDDSHLRAHSTDSNDSISGEMNHFKPIHVSPRTAHKKLPDGRAESPPIVFTTPRNLNKLEQDEDSPSSSHPMSSILKARWEELEAERSSQVSESSKSTMTSISRHLRQQLSRQHGRQVRPGDRRDRKGEPPQKKSKVDRSGAGDAVRVQDRVQERVHENPKERVQEDSQERVPENPQEGVRKRKQEKCPMNTLIHMRGEVPAKTKSESPALEGLDDTDFNHNVNNSKSSDSKRVPAIDEPDGVCCDAVVANGRSKDSPNGRLKGGALSGKEDVKARDVSANRKEALPKQSRKKEYTPIKEYSMREQTKLQTRVTKNSIKDLFNAKRAKMKFADTGGDKQKSQPALPNLPSLGTNGVETFLSGGKTSQGPAVQSNGKDDARCERNAKSPVSGKSKNTSSANGRTAANQRCDSGSTMSDARKDEVSYEDWLSSNGCRSESMQEEGQGTGKNASQGKSFNVNRVGKTTHNNPSDSFVEPSWSESKSKNNCDVALGNLDNGHPSSSKVPSSQDSDVSMASVDLTENSHASERGKSGDGRGKERGKERGKAKPPRGAGSSRKSPRKSEDTILKYMELLSEEQQRLKQEDADRLMAERLQKQFDKESKRDRDNVDRSKGTEDAYQLRLNQRSFYHYME